MKNKLKTKLQIRFVLLSVATVFVLLAVIFAVNAYYGYRDLCRKSDIMIKQIAVKPEANIRHFSVSFSGDGEINFSSAGNETVTREAAVKAAEKIVKSGKESGFSGEYRYNVFSGEKGIKIIFISRAQSLETYKSNLKSLAVISLCGIAVMAAALSLLSGAVVRPIVENHKKQKQFITHAGHELKTPLTVISADAQLLESETGENEWISDINAQVRRLTEMTESLIELAKAQEQEDPPHVGFSLSLAAAEAAESCRAAAKAAGLSFDCAIAENVTLSGDEAAVRRLISVLLDNANKYCAPGGGITFLVEKKDRGAVITVKNTVKDLDEKQLSRFKERFWRGDNSGEKRGFGLGLAIAEGVVEQHRGSMEIKLCGSDEIAFICTLHG